MLGFVSEEPLAHTLVKSIFLILSVSFIHEGWQAPSLSCFQLNLVLAGLKQKSSPNQPQTCFIGYEYVMIMIEPLDKTIRTSDKSPFGKHDSEETSESVSSRYSCTKCLQCFRKRVQRFIRPTPS